MKKLNLLIILAVFAGMISCGGEEKKDFRDSVVALNDSHIEVFIELLPEVLSFSREYRGSLSPKDLDSPDFNQKFYKALSENKNIKEIVVEYGFKDTEEFLKVYDNVAYAYARLKGDFRNYDVQIAILEEDIRNEKNDLKLKISRPNLHAEEKETLKSLLEIVAYKEIVLENIKLVRLYQDRIAELEASFAY
jgi:hypothetical protein